MAFVIPDIDAELAKANQRIGRKHVQRAQWLLRLLSRTQDYVEGENLLWEICGFLGRKVDEDYANTWYRTIRNKLRSLNSTHRNSQDVWNVRLETWSATFDLNHTLQLQCSTSGAREIDCYRALQTLNGHLRRCTCMHRGSLCRTLFIRIKAQRFCNECRRKCAPNIRLLKHRAKKKSAEDPS